MDWRLKLPKLCIVTHRVLVEDDRAACHSSALRPAFVPIQGVVAIKADGDTAFRTHAVGWATR